MSKDEVNTQLNKPSQSGSSGQRISVSSDDSLQPEEELFYVIKSSDSEEGKIRRLKKIFDENPKPNINFQNRKGDTLLHISVRKVEVKVINWLLQNGAKSDIKNHQGKTQIETAKIDKHHNIVNILETKASGNHQTDKNISRDQNLSAEKESSSAKTCLHKSSKTKTARRIDPVHGHIYQLKLLMLFLYRGVLKKYSFRLGREIAEAKKFDDLVFEYYEGGQKIYRLLQAKHRLNENGQITTSSLLSEDYSGDYSLVKYFFSYKDAHKEKLFQDGTIENITLCTNIDFDMKELQNEGIKVEEIKTVDSILDIKNSKGKKYKFNEHIIPKLRPLLEDVNQIRLARRLVTSLINGNPIQHHNKNDIFFLYHGVLATEIIDKKMKVFLDKFIKGEDISGIAQKFRDKFLFELDKQSNGQLNIQNLNKAITNREVVDKTKKSAGLQLSKNFGNGSSPYWPENTIQDAEIIDFLDHMIYAVNQPNEDDLGNVIKQDMGRELDLDLITTENTYQNFFCTMLEWYQGKKRERFLSYQEGKDFFEEAKRGLPIFFDIQNAINPSIQREQELKNLYQNLRTNKIVSISGLGGVGKSELAKKFVNQHSEEYGNHVVWISAENSRTLNESFRRLAIDKLGIKSKNAEGKEKNIKTIVEDVYRFFWKGRSLFVFDNAEQFKGYDGISEFLPSLPQNINQPHILLTSRNKNWPENIKVMFLDVPNASEVVAYLKDVLQIDEIDQDDDISQLLITLQYLPLALQQAIAYVKLKQHDLLNVGSTFTIRDYINRYEEKTKELLDFPFPENNENNYTKTTFITWTITLDRIKEKKYGDKALEILNLMSFFAPEKIPVSIFLLNINDGEVLGCIIGLLKQYSMITSGNDQAVVNIHRLVQEVTRLKLGENKIAVLFEALKLFQETIKYPDISDIYAGKLRLSNIDHVISVWTYANDFKPLVQGFNIIPVFIVAELEASLKYQDAYLFGNKTLKLLQSLLYRDHFAVLSMTRILASVCYTQGKDNEALELYTNLNEKIPLFKANIGLILNRQGKYDEAFTIFSNQHNEFNHLSDGTVEHNLAMTYFNKGQFKDSMDMYQKALNKKIKSFGPDHAITLNTENGIAAVFENQGKFLETLEIHERVFRKRKEILGENHPDTLTSQGNMAIALSKLGKHEDALNIAVEVDCKREKVIPNHHRTLKGKLSIVEILIDLERYSEALAKCKVVYMKRKKVLGSKHSETLLTLDKWYYIGLKLAEKRNFSDAVNVVTEVLEEQRVILEPDDPKILQTQITIQKLLNAQHNGTDIKVKVMDENFVELAKKLWIAAHKNNINDAIDILKKGANPNSADDEWYSALHFAAQAGHAEMVKLLLEYDANIDAETLNGNTPLCLAVYYGHIEAIKTLLESGANIDAVNCYEQTPVDATNDEKIKNLLLSTKELYKAIRQRFSKTIIKNLLDNGAVVNYFLDTTRLTSLHFAVSLGDLDIVKMLLGSTINVNVADEDGWTPLHYAVSNGDFKMVLLLLECTANPNNENSNQRTCYQLAYDLRQKNFPIYQKIIEILESYSINQRI